MTIVVYGAAGWTGSLTARALDRAGLPIVLAGRDEAKLCEVSRRLPSSPPIRVASLDPAELDRALAGATTVVHCAGPYREVGEPVMNAALRARCHYFDASGEYGFLRDAHARYDRDARARGLIFCPGFAAKGALGDWGATAAAHELDHSALDEVAIAYAHGLREYLRPSAGSVLSAAGQDFLKQADDYDPDRSVARCFPFPPPFGRGWALLVPGAEDVSLPRHLPVSAVRSFLSLAPGSPVNELWARVCLAWLPVIPDISRLLERERAQLERALAEPRQEQERDGFMVSIEVTSRGRCVRMAIAARDAYAVTAAILAHGVGSLGTGPRSAGVVPPSILCDARDALASLSRAGALRVSRFVGDSAR
ncbi:MAG TPA: saccharopine dehydrogenase NADP-binding domain-containing protein [Polyangiaceae bacterium]|nr:saccharopine dehydrogenase NADP-binding domain-containing protein [Polyangiaceae bacterium]